MGGKDGLSALDEAYGLRGAGEREAALRLAVGLLEGSPEQLGAAALCAFVLAESERDEVAGEVAKRLVDAFVRRGDLPAAVVATRIADAAGEDGGALRERIARAFGKGSSRLAAGASPAPPPLPKPVKVSKALKRLKGDALLDRAEAALQKHMAEEDPVAEGELPEWPLFSRLAPPALRRLLDAFGVRDAGMNEAVIEQRAEGREAFVLVRGAGRVVRTDAAGDEVTLAMLGPGAIFGEMALVTEAPRAASVVATEPLQLLVASREDLERLAAAEPVIGEELAGFCRSRMIANLLSHSPILAAIDPASRTALVDRFEVRNFEARQPLIRQGEETHGLYLIASGAVGIVQSDDAGERTRLAELGAGDVVGEISLVLRRPATADAVATCPTVALLLTRDEFQKAIKDYPALLNELYDLAVRREEETRTVVAQKALDVEDVVLV